MVEPELDAPGRLKDLDKRSVLHGSGIFWGASHPPTVPSLDPDGQRPLRSRPVAIPRPVAAAAGPSSEAVDLVARLPPHVDGDARPVGCADGGRPTRLDRE